MASVQTRQYWATIWIVEDILCMVDFESINFLHPPYLSIKQLIVHVIILESSQKRYIHLFKLLLYTDIVAL